MGRLDGEETLFTHRKPGPQSQLHLSTGDQDSGPWILGGFAQKLRAPTTDYTFAFAFKGLWAETQAFRSENLFLCVPRTLGERHRWPCLNAFVALRAHLRLPRTGTWCDARHVRAGRHGANSGRRLEARHALIVACTGNRRTLCATLLRSLCERQRGKGFKWASSTDSPDCQFRQPFVANLFVLAAQRLE